MRASISVEDKVAMSLMKLGTRNRLELVVDLSGIAICIVSMIERIFQHGVNSSTEIALNKSRLKALARNFEILHGIPHIIGAIHRSHIPILAPLIGGDDYYCRKLLHSALLQGIVDTKCVLGTMNLVGAGNKHDRIVFQFTKVRKMCIEGKLL